MDTTLLAAFWLVSFSLVMTPGADWAYAISAGLRNAVALAVTGMLLGYVAITIVVAAGVGALVASVPAIMTALTVLGAAYLGWLGIAVLRDQPVPGAGHETARSPRGWIVRGFGISGLNPKALLLYLALLPQFISTGASWPLWLQMIALGGVQMVNCAIVYTAVGLGSRAVLGSRPAAARVVGRISGVIMIGLAIVLVVELFLK